MKKPNYTLTQTDIICFAIMGLNDRVAKMDKWVKECTDEKMKEGLKDNEFFFKFKKLLELYEIQTGKPYDLEFDYDFLKE